MSMTRGTVVGRMARARCPVCGQDDVAVRADGVLHPAHLKSRRHVEVLGKVVAEAIIRKGTPHHMREPQ